MMQILDDTIAAVATPIGEGGLGVIRISGAQAVRTADRIFRPVSGMSVESFHTYTAHYGFVKDPESGEHIDDGVLTVFLAPRSYTGEDTVEISCHGGLTATRRVLEAALQGGARLAEPGEFTKRAFLNGRIDLAQAEAVLDIIRARTNEAMRVARQQLDGMLSQRVRSLRDELIGVVAYVEASIDFPEDVGEADPAHVAELACRVLSGVNSLLETADRGRIYREGIRAAIVGRPNVGKSSLLNAILRESRAIVTPIPGTTRDVIEESTNIRGIPVKAIDTAGVRETDDPVERIGVGRARGAAEQADIVLLVLDAAHGMTPEDQSIISEFSGKRAIVILNKCDLVTDVEMSELAARVRESAVREFGLSVPVVRTAARTNIGIAEVEDAIASRIMEGGISTADAVVVSNVRHRQALEDAHESLLHVVETAESGLPVDLISVDLNAAVMALGSVTGETVAEDVIDRIFSEFCIGK